ncbi:hypothetical protein EDB89DRAFT_1910857 [Lactarius sanguifluus]|nr:hypothetical protein EDB89DRAFT_1910857 [Lactarius sanguifluus]
MARRYPSTTTTRRHINKVTSTDDNNNTGKPRQEAGTGIGASTTSTCECTRVRRRAHSYSREYSGTSTRAHEYSSHDESNLMPHLLMEWVKSNKSRIVHDSSFIIRVPTKEEVGRIIRYVKEVTPSLKDIDYIKFRFYKPPVNHLISVSDPHPGFQLTREHLRSPLYVSYSISEEFPESNGNCCLVIDVIIQIDSGAHGGIVFPTRTLPSESINTWLHYVTLHLLNRNQVQLPLESQLWHNKVCELLQDESSPEFVMQLKEELHLSHVIQPNNNMAMTQSLLHPVRSFLGDKAFCEHFINPGLGDGSGSEACHVMAIEALHYANTISLEEIRYQSYLSAPYDGVIRGSVPGDDSVYISVYYYLRQVEYCMTPYKLTNRDEMFMLVFQIYNLIPSIRALHARLPPQLRKVLSSILADTKDFPYAIAKVKHSAEDSISGNSKW